MVRDRTDEPIIVATLSPAGQKYIFSNGRDEAIRTLLNDCFTPTDRDLATGLRWHFADPAAKSPDLAETGPRPTLPDVIGRDVQRSKQILYLYVPGTLAWFDGHFPDDPILPAVVQIDWIIRFAGSGLDRSRFSGLHRLKFLAVIAPDTVLKLSTRTANEALEFTLESRANLHSKGTIRFLRSNDQR